MAGGEGSTFDKAESLARRVLERLGAEADKKLGLDRQPPLTRTQISEIISRLELSIESNLRDDASGCRRVAPNRFQVSFTYERGPTGAYASALGKELRAAVFEYVNNRRYETSGEIVVEVGSDVFAKALQVKSSFDNLPGPPGALGVEGVRAAASHSHTIVLQVANASVHRVELEAAGVPISIGRSPENAVRIDDHSISRVHCSLALRGSGHVVVSDLGSSNGTFVNGERLAAGEARPLKQGDSIQAGDVRMIVAAVD